MPSGRIGSWLNSSIGSPMQSRSTHQRRRQHLMRRGLDRRAVAGGDALLVDQRAAHADERRAGCEIGGDIAGSTPPVGQNATSGSTLRSARICAGPPTEEAGNTFTTSAPAASAARTSVGVSAPSISTAFAALARRGERGIDPGCDDEACAGGEAGLRGGAVRHRAGADQQRGIRGQLADQRRRVRDGHGDLEDAQAGVAQPLHRGAACRASCVRTTGTTRAARSECSRGRPSNSSPSALTV